MKKSSIKLNVYKITQSKFAMLSIIAMLLSVTLKVVYTFIKYNKLSYLYLITQSILPIICSVSFVVIIIAFKDKFALSSISVWIGIIFFVFRIFDIATTTWHIVLCAILYAAVGIIYTTTVFDIIKNKICMTLVFALPLAFHIVEDLINAFTILKNMSFINWLPELSVILIMSSLLFITLAIKKQMK
ncbi:MAG: hypothetical protein RR054_05290 [Clostridia bacterium]